MSKQSDQSPSFSKKHAQPEQNTSKTGPQKQDDDPKNLIQKQNKIKPLPKKDQNNEENQQDQENSQNEQKIWTKKYHWKDAFNEQSLKGTMGPTPKQYHSLIKQELFDKPFANPQKQKQEMIDQKIQSGTQQIKKTKQFLRNDDLKIHKIKMETVIWSDERSKYELAEFVIKLIQNKRYYQRLSECSLRDRICLEIINHPNASENGKKQILKLFQEGVYLNSNVFSQQRITQEIKNQNQFITFCPTYFGTSTIFSHILNSINGKRMITGHYGHSKTFSTVLYSKLTNFIIDFRLNYQKNQKQQVQVIKHRHKTFYLAFNLPQYETQFKWQQSLSLNFIKQNCQQVKQYLTYTDDGKIKQNDYQIIKLYKQKGIKILLILDQTNVLASIARKKILRKLDQQISQNDKKKEKIYSFFMDMYSSLISVFNSMIYLTSSNIDEELVLRQLNLGGQINHTPMTTIQINFFQQQLQNEKILQLVDFFIFQFGEKIRLSDEIANNWHLSLQNHLFNERNKLRNELYTILKEKYYSSYLSNLSISLFFKNQKSKINVQYREINQKNLIQKSVQLLKDCIQYSIQMFKKKIISFFKTQKDTPSKFNQYTKKQILTVIYLEAQANCKQNNFFIQPRINLSVFQGQQRTIIQQHINNNTQKQLFSIEKQKKSQQYFIKLYCCSGLLLKILKSMVEGVEKIILSFFIKHLKTNDMIKLGGQYEQNLITLLMIKDTTFYLQRHSQTTKFNFILDKAYPFETIPIQIKQSSKIDPFEDIKKYSLVESLQKGIKKLLDYNDDYNEKQLTSIICLPVQKSYKDQYAAYNDKKSSSKLIDFVILRLPNQTINGKTVVQIHAIDTSIAETTTYIRGKVYDFLIDFKNMKDVNRNLFTFQNQQTNTKYEVQIKLKYHILGCNIKLKKNKNDSPKKISDFIQEKTPKLNKNQITRKDLEEKIVNRSQMSNSMKFKDEKYPLLQEISIVSFSNAHLVLPSENELTQHQKEVDAVYKFILEQLKNKK